MRLKIVRIADPGVPNFERIHLAVLGDVNLVYYMLSVGHKFPNGNLLSGTRAAFWFPNSFVKAGDNVILYTGSGNPSNTVRPDALTDHFVFWGMPNTIFNVPGSCAVLVEISAWESGR